VRERGEQAADVVETKFDRERLVAQTEEVLDRFVKRHGSKKFKV
jgi:hypothetical protein